MKQKTKKSIFTFVFLFLTTFFQNIEATTTKEVFAKYPNKYFIESGTCMGDGVNMALECGFDQIYSFELANHLYNICCKRFAHSPNVHLILGDTTKAMPQLLKEIDSPATFWLDGHYSWNNTARGDTNSPILQELEIIQQHHIKNHTILVDDIRQCGTVEFDFIELDEIIQKILEINPDYTISFEDGYVPNDVLVAKIINKELFDVKK